MRGLPIYAPDCSDFSSNGVAILQPIECTIEETANGLYELTMELPIDTSGRFALVTPGAVIKAVAPARESPLYEEEAVTQEVTSTTVSRQIYRVNTSSGRLRLRQKPSSSAKILSSWAKGTEVTLLEQTSSAWWKVSIVKGGAVGYMSRQYLTYVRTVTDTITQTRPVTQNGVKVQIAREQLFRVYSVENDTEQGIQTAHALHIFYDLRCDFINSTYAPEGVAASTVAQTCFNRLRYVPEHTLYASRLTGLISTELSWKNFAEALLDPDEGIVPLAEGCIFRDNFDVFLLPDEERDMGVTVRRGKNLIGVTVTTDDSEVVTRIQPCGKDANGNNKFLANSACVDSPRINEYPVIRAQKVDYNVVYDPSQATSADEGRYHTESEFYSALTTAANVDFRDGADQPSYGMDVDFTLLENTAEYSDYARLQAVHLFDTVTVIDELIGLTAKLRVTAYTWNVLTEQYESISLGDIQDMEQKTYSFNLSSGSVSSAKIQGGSTGTNAISDGAITTAKLADGAVTYGKIASAAKSSLFLSSFPVGAVYTSASSSAPTDGTWSSIGTQTVGGVTVYFYQRTA